MSLSGLLAAAAGDPALTAVSDHSDNPEFIVSGPAAVQPFAIAAAVGAGRTVLAVAAGEREAHDIVSALRCLLPPDRVALYPGWETLPHERLSPRADTVGQRLAVLRRLSHPSLDDPSAGPLSVVVAPVRAVLQPQVPNLGELVPVELHAGDTGLELTEIVVALANAGYSRSELVERRGDFAVRGGILDVFPPTEEHPLRVEFWGDEVEEIRYFKVADQRSLEIAEHGLWAPPCRELLLTDDVRARATTLLAEHPELGRAVRPDQSGRSRRGHGIPGAGAGRRTRLGLLIDELPAEHDTSLLCDPERVRTRAYDLVRTSQEFLDASWAAAAGGGKAPVDLGCGVVAGSRRRPRRCPAISASAGGVDHRSADLRRPGLTSCPVPARSSSRRPTAATPKRHWATCVPGRATAGASCSCSTATVHASRALERMSAAEMPARLVADPEGEPDPSARSPPAACSAAISHLRIKLAYLTEADLTGQRGSLTKDRPAGCRPAAATPSTRSSCKSGDFVVHEQHGVGKYVEMVRRTVNGGEREYLIIEYAAAKKGQPGDRLFVPTDALDQVTKYVGGEAPSLNTARRGRLGQDQGPRAQGGQGDRRRG